MYNKDGFTLVELLLVLGVTPLICLFAYEGIKIATQNYAMEQSVLEFQTTARLASDELGKDKKCTAVLENKEISLSDSTSTPIDLNFAGAGTIREGYSEDRKLYYSKVALVKLPENAGVAVRAVLRIRANPVKMGQIVTSKEFSKDIDIVIKEKVVAGAMQVEECAKPYTRSGQCLSYTRYSECNSWDEANGSMEVAAIAGFACSQLTGTGDDANPQGPSVVCAYNPSLGELLPPNTP